MIRPINILLSQILTNPLYRTVVSIIAAFLLSLNLACFNYPVMAWIGLIPLILLNKSCQKIERLFLESFIFFFIYNLLSFAWLFSIHPLNWLGIESFPSIIVASLAWLIPSLYHSVFLLIFSLSIWIFYRLKDRTKLEELSIVEILILAFTWSLIQYKILASTSFLSLFAVPINQLAYGQYLSVDLSKLVRVTGAVGLEIIIVTFNLLVANLIHVYDFNNTKIKMFYQTSTGFIENLSINSHIKTIFGIVILFVFTGAYINFIADARKPVKALSFTLVQANLNRKDTRVNLDNLDKTLELQEKLSQIKKKSHLLIWTEASIPTNVTNMNHSAKVMKLISRIQKEYEYFIFGTYSNIDGELFNSLKLIDIKEEKVRTYNKAQLVPFGEYTPFINLLPETISKLATSTIGTGFSAGKEHQKLLEFNDIKVGSSICFELLFPEIIRRQTRDGANFLVNVNDLSWFQNDNMKKLFLAVAVIRAAENSKDLILVGNTGYSALIKRDGQIHDLTKINQPQAVHSAVGLDYSKSFYSEFGW
ncbi:MAG: apolipoprotein N-acyltransferase [Proteobacteria bacterium]|nr:apolipoprotein N-acyltransferase [Pseudomonadota bacterium]